MPPKHVQSKEEWNKQLDEAKEAGKTVIVDFWATWCGPCKMIGPTFDQMSDEDDYANLVFLKVDVDELPEIAEEAEVSAMPTFQVWKDKQKAEEIVGASQQKLEDLLQRYKGN